MSLLIAIALLGQSGYAGSPLEAVNAALEVANVTADDTVLDIGCGDGRVCALAAKKYGCKAIGIELDRNLANLAVRTAQRNALGELVEIRHEDALKSDLSQATVVYLYHQAKFLEALRPQLDKLKPGTRVVCLDYFPPWLNLSPSRTFRVDQHEHRIYSWTAGACGVGDSVLVAGGRVYPGVKCLDGLRDPFLVEQAQSAANILAANGERAYWTDGHPGWDSRFRLISSTLGMGVSEVTAFSWPDSSEKPTPEIVSGLYYDWQRSPGHWSVVSRPHKRFGDGIARSRNGIWYSTIIVAD